MDTKSRDIVLRIQLQKKQELLRSIQLLKMIALAIVFLTIFIAYFRPASSTCVFISLLSFLTVQFYATQEYAGLAKLARRIRLMQGGSCFPCNDVRLPWKIAAGVAVRDAYFLLLLFFDLSWLAHAYLYPSPAHSFNRFLEQLRMGPVSGTAFIWFTVLLWAFYAWLFITGLLYSNEINLPEEMTSQAADDGRQTGPRETWIKVNTCDGDELYLQAHRLRNANKQPLILFPGFFQNGYVYHLSEEVSLARFLRENGFDVWIIHPRGTAQSDGRGKASSLDDFAGDDIPAVIDHVFSRTGIKPVFVGHSQGGISAIISLMGAVKLADATVVLSDTKKNERQNSLKALVTMGSFLDFSFSKPSWLKSFVAEGICIKTGKSKIRLLRSQSLLKILEKLSFVGTPLSFSLRSALLQSRGLSTLLFPVTLIFNFLSGLKLWEFLYHIPNLDGRARKRLFYKTMDGTFSPILRQFYLAVADEGMKSVNGRVNYSLNYSRLTLPVSIVAMEFDSLADPQMMKQKMFDPIGSDRKFFTVWNGVGHEDHFTNTRYFPQVLAAIRKVCE